MMRAAGEHGRYAFASLGHEVVENHQSGPRVVVKVAALRYAVSKLGGDC